MVDTVKHGLVDYSAGSEGAHLRAVKAWLSRARGTRSDTTQQQGDWRTKGGSGWQSSAGVSYNPDTFDVVNGVPVRDTNETFRDADGSWDPKRLDLHAAIVRKYVEGVPKGASSQPTVYFLGGGPASGKSSLEKGSMVNMPQHGDAVVANPDECRYDLPEWGALREKYPERAAFMTQEEASQLSKDILASALANGQDCVLDTAGDNGYESLKKKTEQIRAAGGRIVANYATLPTEEAYARSVARASNPVNKDGSPNRDYGRYCAKSYLTEMHANISRDFEKSHELFDDVKLWSGPGYPGVSGGKPRLIASGGRGKPFIIHDKILYAQFLSKSKLKPRDIPSLHSAGGRLTRGGEKW